MSKNSSNDEAPVGRLERVLAFMSFGLVIVSILSFFAIMIATAAGMKQADFSSGVWPAVAFVPWIGLPIAFALLIALIIVNSRKRRRA